jgi:DNA-binding NarL/FixJ family response regulator
LCGYLRILDLLKPVYTLGGIRNTVICYFQNTLPMKSEANTNNGSSFINLTDREREVLYQLSKGLSSRKIAEKLKISFHTVETHRKKLLIKFNSHTTVEMILKAGNVLPESFWS